MSLLKIFFSAALMSSLVFFLLMRYVLLYPSNFILPVAFIVGGIVGGTMLMLSKKKMNKKI